MHTPEISIVIPLYQEQENVAPLLQEIAIALSDVSYELLMVDDGSTDNTFSRIEEACATTPYLIGIRLARNFGQTAAMDAGFEAAQGRYIVYMDGDLQTDPTDILPMLAQLKAQQLDLINGWRKNRHDNGLTRNLPSRIANTLIRNSLGIQLHDHGCPMKVMCAHVAKNLHLYGEQHRMLPAIAAIHGARVGEMVVRHRPRRFGHSKYGLGRTSRVLIDLLLVLFFQRFTDRPLQLFGSAGLFSCVAGIAIDSWLTIQKLLFGANLAERPLLQLGSLLIVSGILLFGIGLILELQMRTYYESTGNRYYTIRHNTSDNTSNNHNG